MSGPKAFRIVTRAEIIAICRRDVARLDAAIEGWTAVGKRNGTIEQADLDKVTARRNELRRLLDADRFVELQKQVAAEIAFLHADSDIRVERAAEMAARSQRNLRRSKAAADALLQKLQDLSVAIPADMRNELSGSTKSSERLEAAMAKALLLLPSQGAPVEATDRQRELAARLGVGERRESLQDWMSRQPHDEDPALARVDRLFGELRGLGIDPSPFGARIAVLEAETPSRRPLIADSLLLDLAAAVKDGRAQSRLASELHERRAELSVMRSPEAVALLAEIDKAVAAPTAIDRHDLVQRANFLIEEEFKAMAAEERRRAVLEGLASLGYEVSEGMATAWVQNGQIVLRKVANPGYGVELSGGSKSDLLQVRAVGIGSSVETRDGGRDRDMETIWCGEFDRLKALVAKAGGNVSIESARPVGQFPLKVVSDPAGSHIIEVTGRSHKSLPG